MILLIESQYYFSRHYFLVEYDSNTFPDQAKFFVNELEKYKRKSDVAKPIEYGDLEYFEPDRRRYNINDSGDIYFTIFNTATGALREIKEEWERSNREGRGFQRKEVLENIAAHHNYQRVWEMIDKHFVWL